MKDSGRILKTGFFYRFVHYSDDPTKTPAWALDKSVEYGGMNSPRWRREMEGDWKTYIGERVWPMADRNFHHRKVYLDKEWSLYRVIDHGVRHPTCCLWFAVNKSGDRHIYREYYMTDTPVSVNCQNILRMSGDEPIIETYIDPSTSRRENYMSNSRGKGLARLIDIYEENGLYCSKADNSSVGYDKVGSALMAQLACKAAYENRLSFYLSEMGLNKDQLLLLASKPRLTFDIDSCPRCFAEVENLRWQNLIGDSTQKSSPEKIVDVDDEGCDCVRYSFTEGIGWCQKAYRPQGGTWQSKIHSRKIQEIQEKYHSWN